MQPKCSITPSTAATSLNQSNQSTQPSLHISPDRFKDICLRNNNVSDYSKDIACILEQFFDPEKQLDIANRNDADTLKQYISGGYSFDTFKTKSKQLFSFRSLDLNQNCYIKEFLLS